MSRFESTGDLIEYLSVHGFVGEPAPARELPLGPPLEWILEPGSTGASVDRRADGR